MKAKTKIQEDKPKRKQLCEFEPRMCQGLSCENVFTPTWEFQKFCSVKCRDAANQRFKINDPKLCETIRILLRKLPIDHPLFIAARNAIQARIGIAGNKSPKRKKAQSA